MTRDISDQLQENALDPSETIPLNSEFMKKKAKIEKVLPKKDERKISYFQLFRYATLQDKFFIALGTICSVVCGVIQPYVMILFGDVTGVIVEYAAAVNKTNDPNEIQLIEDTLYDGIRVFAIYSCTLGIVTIIATYLAGVFFSYSALRQIFHIRKIILKKTLNMDVSWYDLNKTGDFATTFTDNLLKFEEGIGEKVATFIFFQSVFVSGIVMALVLGWKLALVCLVSLPVSFGVTMIVSWVSNTFHQVLIRACHNNDCYYCY
jgi:ATP-binding cassette subfamily B (MDR/TAP) protein 1